MRIPFLFAQAFFNWVCTNDLAESVTNVDETSPMRANSALTRAVAIKVLDGRFVAPRDRAWYDSKHIGDTFAFARAGCPAAEDDCRDSFVTQPRLLGQILNIYAAFTAQISNIARHRSFPISWSGLFLWCSRSVGRLATLV